MLTATLTISPPAWFPPALSKKVKNAGRMELRGRFSRAEKKVLRKRKRVPVSRWVEKHRVLTMSALPGPWRNHVTPYLTDIMDASFFPSVQTIIICAAQQTATPEPDMPETGYSGWLLIGGALLGALLLLTAGARRLLGARQQIRRQE